MILEQIIREESRIRQRVTEYYVDQTQKSWPIYDGIVNPIQYVSSSPRILWVLKEPYDGGEAYEGGGWSLTEDLLNKDPDGMARKPAFQPICYIDYGIRNSVYDWDQMPWLRSCEEMRTALKGIAFINVSKLPGLKTTPWSRIVEAYEKYRDVILDQIKTYAPHIIFACDPHVNLIRKDFGLDESQWKWFGTAAVIQITPDQKLIWVAHPSARVGRRNYVNDAIKAATNAQYEGSTKPRLLETAGGQARMADTKPINLHRIGF